MEDKMIGRLFDRLKVIERADDYISPSGGSHVRYKCLCSCGNTTIVYKEHLITMKTRSCGCLKKENGIFIHGEINTRLYRIWGNMCNRCSNPNNPAWDRYGGAGIYVCDAWKDFVTFRNWAHENGYSDELTIDRIDNNKGYEPNNCRWATRIQQANNKKDNHLVEYNGKVSTIGELAAEFDIPYKTLHRRIVSLGWDISEAVTKPLRKRTAKHN